MEEGSLYLHNFVQSTFTALSELGTDITTGSSADTVNFTSATDVQLGALAVYTDAMSITTKKGATLDIGSLDDLNAAGTAVDMGLTVNGPKDVTISGWDDSYTGTITATNVENLTISGYEGAIVIADGTANVTITGAVDVSLSTTDAPDDLATVDITTKLFDDPNVAATAKAPVAYAAYGKENSLTFSSADLTSIKLSGYWLDVNSTDNQNLTEVDIDATMRNLTLTNNDNLVTLDVTGSEIANVTMTNNDGIATAVFDHTTELNYRGATADDTDVVVTITGNQAMTSLTWNASNVSTLAVNDNDKLATVDFTGLAAISTLSTVDATVNVYDNNITVATATDATDGVTTQYAIDGATAGVNNDALDLGSYTTDSGMSTLKPYLLKVLANADAAGAVNFDTVTTHTVDTGATQGAEVAGAQNSGNASTFETDGGGTTDPDSNWVGLVWGNVASDYVETNPTARTAQDQQRAWVLDLTDLPANTTTVDILINNDNTLLNPLTGGTGIAVGSSSNQAFIISQLKTTATTTRATNLGATLNVYKGANSTMPAIVFQTSTTSESTGEKYTAATHDALSGGDGTLQALVTTYDLFTLTYGNRSAAVTLSTSADAEGSSNWSVNGHLTGTSAANAVANRLAIAWNAKYGLIGTSTGGELEAESFWGAALTSTAANQINALAQISENAGSRPYGQTMSMLHTKGSAANVSLTTGGSVTQTMLDWVIGTDDATLTTSDDFAASTDLIISLTEVTEDAIVAGTATLMIAGGAVSAVELTTSKTAADALSTTLATDIFDADAGIYGAISSGGAGDVRKDETVDEGSVVTTTTGAQRGLITRLHWLS